MPENIAINAMNLGELETDVLKKLWIHFNEDTDGFAPATAFSKYSQYRVQKKINQVYAEMVVLTRSLRSWFIVPLKQYYSQYPVPTNCFDVETVYYFSSATSYSELEIIEDAYLEDQLLEGWRTTSGTPGYAFVGDRNKMVVKLGIAPAPAADATPITLASGRSKMDYPYGSTEAVSGSATVGSGATAYVDSLGQNFTTLGVIAGMVILNISDGSKGTITTITTTNTANDTINVAALAGGALNTWTAGDEMRIVSPGEYGNIIEIGEVEADYILSPTPDLPAPGITMAANNLLVRGFMYPILLVDRYQYPELSPIYHPYIAMGAAASLGKEDPADSPEFAQSTVYEEQYNSMSAFLSNLSASQYRGNYQIQSKVKP